MGAVPAIREEEILTASCAEVDAVDVRLGQAHLFELRAIRGRHVEMFPVPLARDEEAPTRFAEGFFHLRAHLVTTRADRRAQRGHELPRVRPRRDHGANRRLGHSRHGPSPARMGRRHASIRGIDDQDRKTVGGFDREEQAGIRGETRVGVWRFDPGRGCHSAAVNLTEEEHVARAFERGRSRGPRGCARPRHPKAETLHESPDTCEAGRSEELHRLGGRHSTADLTLSPSMPLRPAIRRRLLLVLLLLSLAGLVSVHGFWLGPDSLVVVGYSLSPPSWPKALDGFKIVAVGDIHGGAPFIGESKLKAMVQWISAQKPDLIVWLGDYVIHGILGGAFMEPEQVASILSRAEARHGQFAVIGNHDRQLGLERIERAFERARIPILRWARKTLVIGETRLHLFGMDDFELSPDYWPTFRRAEEEWRTISPAEPLLVLSHSPDLFPWIPSRVTLTLASHTHGGQVRFPWLGSPIVPSSFGQRFARGPIVEAGRHLFVNTGIGTSIIPIRLGVPPEISVLTLRASLSAPPASAERR